MARIFFAHVLCSNLIQNYVMRTNTPEDDGQLAPHTINNLTKMAANLSGPARVRRTKIKFIFPDTCTRAEGIRGRFLEEQANALRIYPSAPTLARSTREIP